MNRKDLFTALFEHLQLIRNFFCGMLMPLDGRRLRARFYVPVICVLCSMIFTGVSAQRATSKQFRASVVKVDITPSDPQMLAGYAARQSNGVMHRIYHRIVALDDGTTQFFLVSTEIGKMAPSQYDK